MERNGTSKELIVLISSLSFILLFIHEFDAFKTREWRMFKFVRELNEKLIIWFPNAIRDFTVD